MKHLGLLLCFLVAGLVSVVAQGPFDLVIRGGRIIDGTGRPEFVGDVGVRGDRIVAVGEITERGERELDAAGRVVAPGFIDVHTHAENIVDHPGAENFRRMGVTTVVVGNCGTSPTELPAFFAEVQTARPAINVASLIGHGSVRSQVMGGSFMRPPTAAELDAMKRLVRNAMEAGAVGMSSGLIYLPGTFAQPEELAALAGVVAEFDGIHASHLRNESDRIESALEELFETGRRSGVRLHVSHLKLGGPLNHGKADAVLGLLADARTEGLAVTHDQYAYTAASTGVGALIPDEYREGGGLAERSGNPATRVRILDKMRERLQERGYTNLAYVAIADCDWRPGLKGLRVPEAARLERGSDSLDDQLELILDIQIHGGASAVFHGMSEADLLVFQRDPRTMIASDSAVREFNVDVPHPRGYGNNARVLARYVRELNNLPLPEAVRRMTSLPAETFRLKDRGTIRPGAVADLVVFDPDLVGDRATYEQPHQYATGFAWVLVNGVPVVEADRAVDARPGRVVKRGE